jgi:hypothetical protein
MDQMATDLFMIEEVHRTIDAERRAEAEQMRLARLARPAVSGGRPVRVVLADALRALASYLDRDGAPVTQTQRSLARVY